MHFLIRMLSSLPSASRIAVFKNDCETDKSLILTLMHLPFLDWFCCLRRTNKKTKVTMRINKTPPIQESKIVKRLSGGIVGEIVEMNVVDSGLLVVVN